MKQVLLIISLILGATAVSADERETWLCDGFLYTDKSKGNPFIMYGDGKRYEWKDVRNDFELEFEIEYVAQGNSGSFDIYVGGVNSTASRAFYIQTANSTIQEGKWKKNKMMIMTFRAPLFFDMPRYPKRGQEHEERGYYSTTSCFKQ